MATKPRFGIRLNIQGEMGATSSGFDYALEMARMAEDLGFDSIWIPDHVENAHLDRSKPILEYWTALTAIGAITKRVRLGGHSMNNSFRHPGLTAKIAATLDHVTNGRVILAPGSGWFAAECKSYGFDGWSDDKSVRIKRLDESLDVIRGLFTTDVFNYEGEYFRFEDAYCNPKPVQSPYPPIWIAGDSPPTRELFKKHGDVWFMYSKSPEKVASLVSEMKEQVTDCPVNVAVSAVGLADKSESETLRWAQAYADERKHRFPIPPTADDILRENLVGDLGQVCERIDQWVEAGTGDIVIQPMPPIEGIRFFGDKVLPKYL